MAFAADHDGLEVATVVPGMIFGPLAQGRRIPASLSLMRTIVSFRTAPALDMYLVDVRDVAEIMVNLVAVPASERPTRVLAIGNPTYNQPDLKSDTGIGAVAEIFAQELPEWDIRLAQTPAQARRRMPPALAGLNRHVGRKRGGYDMSVARTLLYSGDFMSTRATVVDTMKSFLKFGYFNHPAKTTMAQPLHNGDWRRAKL